MRQLLRATLAGLFAVTVAGATVTGQEGPTSSGSTPAAGPTAAAGVSQAPAGFMNQAIQGSFFFGTTATGTSGNLDRVAEYEVARDAARPRLALQFWGAGRGIRYDVLAEHGGDGRDQRYFANLDFGRHVRATVDFGRFQHRLDHDPLTYMDSAISTFVIRHTDTDPTAAYSAANSELNARLDVTVPGLEAVRFFLGHRRQMRDGYHQSLTTNHCANCHTVGYTKKLTERTQDLSAGASLRLNGLTLDYTFQNRRFRDDGPTLQHTYDNAVHPQTLADVFLNRVSYDDGNGALPFDRVPEVKKNSHALKARVGLPNDITVVGNFSASQVTNLGTALNTDYTGGGGRIVIPIGQRALFKASVRHYNIDSDSVFVDVGEPVALAGPLVGLTYAEAYPAIGDLDFLRESSLSRSPTDFTMELTYRPWKRTSLNVGYAREALTRTHYEVEKTTTDTFKFLGRGRAGGSLAWQVRFQGDRTKDPFRYVHAAVPEVLQPSPSPGALPFGGLQYFEMYRSRHVDLSSFPTRATQLEERLTWSPTERVSVSGHYRWRKALNDDLTLSDWSQSAHMPGVELWLAPHERVMVTAGYSFQRERLETLFSTLAFVG